MRRIFLVSYLAVVVMFALWGSGIVPAIVPGAVPTANKVGNSTFFQLAGGGVPVSGNCASFDASGNLVDFGAPCNGTAGSVNFANVLSGTNVTSTMTCGAGCAMLTTSTGTITVNGIRNYTVATLGTATAGKIAYVTDGASATDCTVGSGTTKVLCVADGSAFAAVGGGGASGAAGGALAGTYPNPTIAGITYLNSQNCIPFGSSTAGRLTCSANSGYNIYFNDTDNGGFGTLNLRGGLRLSQSAGYLQFGVTSANGLALDPNSGIALIGSQGTSNPAWRCDTFNLATVTPAQGCSMGTAPGSTAMINLQGPTNGTFGGGSPGIPAIVAVSGTGSTATVTGQPGGGMTFTTGNGGGGGTTNGNAGDFTFTTGTPGGGAGTAGTNGNFIVRVGGANEAMRMDNVRHMNYSGTAPGLSTCGTSPAITGDDNVGTVTLGSGGTTTACTLTFANTWNAAPVCTALTSSTSVANSISAVSATAITFTFSADLSSGKLYYQCFQHR